MLLLFPFVVTIVFGLAFGGMGTGGPTQFDIGVVNLDTDTDNAQWNDYFVGNMSEVEVFTLHDFPDNETGQSVLLDGGLDALLVIPEGFSDSCQSYWMAPFDPSSWSNTTVGLYVDSGSMIASGAVPPMVQQVVLTTMFGEAATTLQLPVSVGSPSLVVASTLSQWDFMAPGIFAFAAIFMTMIVAQSLTQERDSGLLKRMSATPVTAGEFMMSQTISYMLIGVVQVALVFASSFLIGYRPDTDIAGLLFAFLIVVAFTLVNVGFGLIVAAISKSAEVASGVAFIFIMPQMFLGTFMPLGGIMETLGRVIPSNYVTHALTTLFLRGAAITTLSIWLDLMVIVIVGVSVLLVGIVFFNRYGNK
jgi:ABC-2 type transport system permease protein